LPHAPAAGSHHAHVSGKCGNFVQSADLDAIEVDLVVDSFTGPSSGLKKLGGDLLTITGSGFPTETAPVVTFDDGTKCAVQSTMATEIKCITGRFDENNSLYTDGDYTLTVAVNGKTATISVSLSESTAYAQSISPVSLSPVLSGELVIQLSSAYPDSANMKVSDFAAELNLLSEPTQGHW
jgi:hypothetical protein